MQLRIVPSKQMDKKSSTKPEEHDKIRLSKVARAFYDPRNWKKTKLLVAGKKAQKPLNIGQAILADIRRRKDEGKVTKNIGFVTTKTFNYLMGKRSPEDIWISEAAEAVTIGADPEFVLINDQGIAQFAQTVFQKKIYDKTDKLGHDQPCAEVRPDPSKSVDGLILNISKILNDKTLNSKIIDLGWVGGASYKHPSQNYRYCIGGHLHFGLPDIPGHNWGNDYDSMAMRRQLIRILDELIALPLVRIDTPYAAERRKKFGKFGDLKENSYKVEYRVLSGLWLVHPHIAKAVLSAAKAVVEESWKRLEDKNYKKSFMSSDKILKSFECQNREKIREIINNSSRIDVSVDMVKKVHKTLKNMSTYLEYSEGIDEFISLCSSKNLILEKQLNLKRGWLERKAF